MHHSAFVTMLMLAFGVPGQGAPKDGADDPVILSRAARKDADKAAKAARKDAKEARLEHQKAKADGEEAKAKNLGKLQRQAFDILVEASTCENVPPPRWLKISSTPQITKLECGTIKTIAFEVAGKEKGKTEAIFNEHTLARFVGVGTKVLFDQDDNFIKVIRGESKFTGLELGDDDDVEPGDVDAAKLGNFFPNLLDHTAVKNSTKLIASNKPCGEQCSVTAFPLNGVNVVMIGSKNAQFFIQETDLPNYTEHLKDSDAILRQIAGKVNSLCEKDPTLISQISKKGARLYAESVEGNHVPPLKDGESPHILFFGVVSAEKMTPEEQFEFLELLKLPVVERKVFGSLEELKSHARSLQGVEGFVVYAFDDEGNYQRFKLKTIWYFMFRMLRQIMKKPETTFAQKVQSVWKTSGERSDGFMNLSEEKLTGWRFKLLRVFVWASSRGVTPEQVDFMKGGSFPGMLKEFSRETKESLDFTEADLGRDMPPEAAEVLSAAETGKMALFVPGEIGLGKTRLAKELAGKLGAELIDRDDFVAEYGLKGAEKPFLGKLAKVESQIVVLPISNTWPHHTSILHGKGYSIVAVVSNDDLQNPEIVSIIDAGLASRCNEGNTHVLKWTSGSIAKVKKDQASLWRKAPKVGNCNVTAVIPVNYFEAHDGNFRRRDLTKCVEDVCDKITSPEAKVPEAKVPEAKVPEANVGVFISAVLGEEGVAAVRELVGEMPGGSQEFNHHMTLAFDKTQGKSEEPVSVSYNLAKMAVGEKMFLRVDGVYNQDGVCVLKVVPFWDEGLTEKVEMKHPWTPHITVYGPQRVPGKPKVKWTPVMAGIALSEANPEMIKTVEGLVIEAIVE